MRLLPRTLLAALLALPCLVLSARQPGSLLVQLEPAAFSIDVPTGWRAQNISLRYQNAEPLYELTPVLPDDPESFYAPRPQILVMYYKNKVPTEAAYRWEFSGGFAEHPSPRKLSTWRLSEVAGKRFAAYTMLGKDVVVIGLECKDAGQYEAAKRVLLSILASYREVKKD